MLNGKAGASQPLVEASMFLIASRLSPTGRCVFLCRGDVIRETWSAAEQRCGHTHDGHVGQPWRQQVEPHENVTGAGRRVANSYDRMLILALVPTLCYCPHYFLLVFSSCFPARASSYSSTSSHHLLFIFALCCLAFNVV
jgi:hypothetical protein